MSDIMSATQEFLRTGIGQTIIFLVAGALFLGVTGALFKKAKMNIHSMTTISLAISLAFLLSFITPFSMPQGGSVTFMSMFVVSLIGFWFGPAIGITAGLSYGLLQTIQGVWIIHPIQFLLDYPIAFSMLGLSGFFRNMKFGMQIGFVVAATGRFIISTIAGFYWLQGTYDNFIATLISSAIYNSLYIFPEIIGTLIIISIPSVLGAINKLTDSVKKESIAIKASSL